MLKRIAADKIEVVRLSIADQHGVLRGKTITAAEVPDAMANGWSFSTTLLLKDTSHRTVYPVFSAGGGFGVAEMEGGADLVMVPDPATFRLLPVGAAYRMDAVRPLFSRRPPDAAVDAAALSHSGRAARRSRATIFVAGLEVEFHIFKLDDPNLRPSDAGQPGQPGKPPTVSLLTQGYQYLTEVRYDQLDPVFELLRTRSRGARAAAAFARGRVWAEPSRAHLPRRQPEWRPPTT